jgi:hypothetical protein
MSRRSYAAETTVSVDKSESEIRALLRRYGADGFAMAEANGQVQIMFQMRERRIVFRVPMPRRDEKRFTHSEAKKLMRSPEQAYAAWEQGCRQKWRALALCIKAKMESIDAGIETFDQAFLAHVMLPEGETVGERMERELPAALEGRPLPPLLGPPQ